MVRIINVRVDESIFNKMERDKEINKIESWDKYIVWLFRGAPKHGK